LAVVFNLLDQDERRSIGLPLYYTGLTNTALIREQDGRPKRYMLDRAYRVEVPVTVPDDFCREAHGMTWLVIQ
jgi:hypothetical protein